MSTPDPFGVFGEVRNATPRPTLGPAIPSPSPSPSAPAGAWDWRSLLRSSPFASNPSDALTAQGFTRSPLIPGGIPLTNPVKNKVWMGYLPIDSGKEPHAYGAVLGAGIGAGTGMGPQRDNLVNLKDAKLVIYSWSPQEWQNFAAALYSKGLISAPVVNSEALAQRWGALVQESANFLTQGIRLSPWDVLARFTSQDAGATDAPETRTNVSVNLSSPETAQRLVDELLTSRIGRKATEQEKADFLTALNAAQSENPTTTTTTTNGTSVSQTTNEGLDPASWAMDWATQNFGDEEKARVVGTDYWDALNEVLSPAVAA